MVLLFSTEQAQNLIEQSVRPQLKSEIHDLMKGRRCLRYSSNALEITAKLLVAIGAVTAFIASTQENQWIQLASGVVNVSSMSAFVLSEYFAKESRERTQQLNILLQSVGLPKIPELIASSDQET